MTAERVAAECTQLPGRYANILQSDASHRRSVRHGVYLKPELKIVRPGRMHVRKLACSTFRVQRTHRRGPSQGRSGRCQECLECYQ